MFEQQINKDRRDERQETKGVKVQRNFYSFDPPYLGMFGLFGPMWRHLVLKVRLEAVIKIGVHRHCQKEKLLHVVGEQAGTGLAAGAGVPPGDMDAQGRAGHW